MPYHIGTVTNTSGSADYANRNFINRLHALLTGVGYSTGRTYAGTGNGVLTEWEGTANTVTETWTLVCTAAATNAGTFSVTGSVSGAQAPLTVGVQYTNPYFTIRIDDGTVDFVVGDTFTFTMSAKVASSGNDVWQTQRLVRGGNRELILKGVGLSGTEEIYIGFRSYDSVASDYYNITLAAFTGYVAGNSFATQPGATINAIGGHNTNIDYWVTWNGQRVVIVTKVGNPVYLSGYVGKFLPYSPPSQYPYPMVSAGTLNVETGARYSDGASHYLPYKGGTSNTRFDVREPAGNWINTDTWPWCENVLSNNNSESSSYRQIKPTGSYYPLTPVMILSSNSILGELDGVYHVPGYGNIVENTITVGGKTYVCFIDHSRTGFIDFFAVRMG